MNWLDAIILLPVLIGLVRGLMKGLVVELMAIIAIVLALLGTKMWGAQFATWIMSQMQWPLHICNTIAYVLLFLGIAIALNILAKLISKLLKAIHLGFVNRLIGGLFGAAKWGIVVLVCLYGINQLDMQFHFMKAETVADSVLYQPAISLISEIWGQLSEMVLQ